MMKRILLAAALAMAIGATASAADFSSVGTDSVELITDYSYLRAHNQSTFESSQVVAAGAQANLGWLGSLSAEGGDVIKNDGSVRSNFSAFNVGYANGFHVGKLGLVGAANYSEINYSQPLETFTLTAEANLPVTSKVAVFGDVSRGHSWVSDDHKADQLNANSITAGVYLNVAQVITKIGYTHVFQDQAGSLLEPTSNGVAASLNIKF